MRQSVKRIAVVVCLSFLVMNMHANAEETSDKAKCGGGSWTTKTDVCAANVSSLDVANEPEFAVVYMTSDQYKDYQANPVGFINKRHIFGKDVIRLVGRPAPLAVKKTAFVYVVVSHWPGSSLAYQGFTAQEPKHSDVAKH